MDAREHTQGNLQLLREKLDSGRMRSARLMVHSLHPGEIARLLESLPLQERAVLWEMVSADDEGDVLVELSDEVRDGLIEGMQTEELIAATAGMDFDDLADLLADLPEVVTKQVLQSLDKADQDRLQQVLAYDEDCAGEPGCAMAARFSELTLDAAAGGDSIELLNPFATPISVGGPSGSPVRSM